MTDRRNFLGSSDIAAVMGISPWMTPLELYERKVRSGPEEEIDERRARFFARRKRQEPVIAEMLFDEYAIEVTRLSFTDPNRYQDGEHPFLAAEIDFEFKMDDAVRGRFARPEFEEIADGTVINGEIKTVHPLAAHQWGEAGSEECPVHYCAQALFGLGVTRRPAVLVAALFGLDNLVCYPLMADQESIAGMRAKAVAFWNDHVLAREPPAPTNMADIMRLFSKVSGRPVEADDTALDLMAKLRDIRGALANYEREKDEVEFLLADWVRQQWGAPALDGPQTDDALVTVGGSPILTWKKQARTSIDSKRLRAERPEVAADFSKTTWFRTFRFPKQQKG